MERANTVAPSQPVNPDLVLLSIGHCQTTVHDNTEVDCR
jgi:hypothetical protein